MPSRTEGELMSSSLDKDQQPSASQLRTARRQRKIIDALLAPGRGDEVAADEANHPGLQELLEAGLAVAHIGPDERVTRIRLTSRGLAAALIIS